jgi:hypothetical protein
MKGGRTTTVFDAEQLEPSAGPVRVEALIEPHDDGLAVHKVVSGPGEPIRDHMAIGSGCFQLVLEGTVELQGVTLGRHSLVFAAAGETLAARTAGPDGVHLLELQCPVA